MARIPDGEDFIDLLVAGGLPPGRGVPKDLAADLGQQRVQRLPVAAVERAVGKTGRVLVAVEVEHDDRAVIRRPGYRRDLFQFRRIPERGIRHRYGRTGKLTGPTRLGRIG